MLGDSQYYYSVNFAPAAGSDGGIFGIGATDWNAVASRILAALGGSARLVGAGSGNITLAVSSSGSSDSVKSSIDQIVGGQPEVDHLTGSMIRVTDPSLNPKTNPLDQITPTMWAVIGLGLLLLLKR